MRHLKDNRGFTLVELVVSIASASLVFFAASMLMLMCVRTQRDVFDAVKEQRTVRVMFDMLGQLTEESDIKEIVPVGTNGWELRSKANKPLLAYDADARSITIGSSAEPALTDLMASSIVLDGNLLTLSLTTQNGSYETSGYCRLLPDGSSGDEDTDHSHISDEMMGDIQSSAGSAADFLTTLCGEYGSTGQIKRKRSGQDYKYYSEWYVQDEDYESHPEWNKDTPWCACFLSWAAQGIDGAPDKFADVDEGAKWFKNHDDRWNANIGGVGDYIFFDWEGGKPDGTRDKGDPDHVGAVLMIKNNIIYTIEGNSGGRVAVRSYHKDDPRILGYGIMLWNTTG